MIRLARVEVRRLLARRLTRTATVALVLLVGVSLYGTQQQVWNATPERIAQVSQEQERSCLDAQSQARQTDPGVDFTCSNFSGTPSSGADADADATTFVDVVRSTISPLAYLLAFFGFVVGATFVAAEFSTGSIGMWLTYEPRRGRVYGSKLTALLVGGLVVAALTLGVAIAATYLFTSHYGLGTTSARAGGGQVWGDALRTLGLVGAAGLIGATRRQAAPRRTSSSAPPTPASTSWSSVRWWSPPVPSSSANAMSPEPAGPTLPS